MDGLPVQHSVIGITATGLGSLFGYFNIAKWSQYSETEVLQNSQGNRLLAMQTGQHLHQGRGIRHFVTTSFGTGDCLILFLKQSSFR
jgi:hypothetical protein